MNFFSTINPRVTFVQSIGLSNGTETVSKNPFNEAYSLLHASVYPRICRWAFPLFVTCAIWRGVVMISCIVILVTPFHRGKLIRSQHLWLIRRRHLHQDTRIPFLIPNRSMAIPLFELVGNAMYLTSACLNYVYYKHPESVNRAHLGLWYGIAWVPSYIGIWVTGWSLCYTCLCDLKDQGRNLRSRILSPILYNLLWLSWPILVIAINLFWGSRVYSSGDRFEDATVELLHSLKAASITWDSQHRLPMARMPSLILEEDRLSQMGSYWATQLRGWSITWVFLGVILAVFYIFTAQHLLRMVRRSLISCEIESLACRRPFPSANWVGLCQEFRFLFKSCVIMSLVLCCEFGVAVFQISSTSHLHSPAWRTASALVVHIPGLVMSPVLLFQSWRIFTERDSADEAAFTQAQINLTTPPLPGFASQLLGYTTTDIWTKQINIHCGNFPGLCQVKESSFSQDDPLTSESVTAMDVKVTRMTTTIINTM